MATHRLPIMGAMTVPDSTGECFLSAIDTQITIGTGAMKNLAMTLKDPTADTGFYGVFQVPQNYVGTPKVVVVGVLDGTPGATSVDFEFSYLTRVDNEAVDAAWEESVTFDTGATSGWADEDIVEDSGTCSANFTAGDTVLYYFKRDQGTDDFNGDFHVLGLYFEYADA